MKTLIAGAVLLLTTAVATAGNQGKPRVALDTNMGRIVLELDSDMAVETVESFLKNVADGFYEGTIFHRVREGFMIQGGGFDQELRLKPTDKQLQNEADNGLSNVRGSIAMARKTDPHSASVQFFINTVDNGFLDHSSRDARGWGYTVFGRVVDGMEVVDAIERVPVERSKVSEAQPLEPVVIEKAFVLTPAVPAPETAEE